MANYGLFKICGLVFQCVLITRSLNICSIIIKINTRSRITLNCFTANVNLLRLIQKLSHLDKCYHEDQHKNGVSCYLWQLVHQHSSIIWNHTVYWYYEFDKDQKSFQSLFKHIFILQYNVTSIILTQIYFNITLNEIKKCNSFSKWLFYFWATMIWKIIVKILFNIDIIKI